LFTKTASPPKAPQANAIIARTSPASRTRRQEKAAFAHTSIVAARPKRSSEIGDDHVANRAPAAQRSPVRRRRRAGHDRDRAAKLH